MSTQRAQEWKEEARDVVLVILKCFFKVFGRNKTFHLTNEEDKMATMIDSSAPLKSVKRVQFGILSADEIVNL